MLVIFGFLVVFLGIIGGFIMGGGYLGVLFQPAELIIIVSGGVGAFIIGNSKKTITTTIKMIKTIFLNPKYEKEDYFSVLSFLDDILNKIKKEGLISIEYDADNPKESIIFKKYPRIVKHKDLVEFTTDYLRIMISGNLDAYEIDSLMEVDIETQRQEQMAPVNALYKLGDSLPAFGIVAAVMGVIHTMASVNLPPTQLGGLIAQALVGTFLGILLAYGVVNPIASQLEQRTDDSLKINEAIKTAIISHLSGYSTQLSIEFARKVLFSDHRPNFYELDDHIRDKKNQRRKEN